MAASVDVEPPRQQEVLELLRQSDEYTLALYPAESAYLLGVDELEADGVSVLVARHRAGDVPAGGVPAAPADGDALGMAALVFRGDGSAELKRMFVSPAARGLGVASTLLGALEAHARGVGVTLIQLETGPLQPEAIALYTKHGYVRIANFGKYAGDVHSVCMEKTLPD